MSQALAPVRKTLIGKKVYIPKLDQEGIVVSQLPTGEIEKVKIGDRIVDVLEDVVEIIPTLITVLKSIFKLLGF